MLALLELQQVDETDDLSYFQIMGAERLLLGSAAWLLPRFVNGAQQVYTAFRSGDGPTSDRCLVVPTRLDSARIM